MFTPSPSQSAVFTALRAFLISVLPAKTEVIQGQTNQVGEPVGNDFVVMTPLLWTRLATSVPGFIAPIGNAANPGQISSTESSMVTVQLDFHSSAPGNSADMAMTVSNLFRTEFAVAAFAAAGPNIAPLYADAVRQMPFVNGEGQYETRWIVEAVIQVNQTSNWPQDFMGVRPAISILPPRSA